MFQSRRQSTFGNINLGKLSATPGLQDMYFLLEQATKYRARFVEVTWCEAPSQVVFQLTTKVLPTQPDPSWMLYRGEGANSELVWGHSSSDITLMHNLVTMECERVRKGNSGTSGISSEAMDSAMANNISAGSIARGTADTQPSVVASNATPGQPQAAAANGAQQFAGADPASMWLRNLSQAPDAYQSSTKLAEPDELQAAPAPDSNAGFHSTRHSMATTVAAVHSFSQIEVGDRLLDGSLANIGVPSLLRYLHEHKMTGRLALQSASNSGEIFVRAGDLKHAATLEGKGENALYDIATWTTGFFHFSGDEQSTQISLAYEATVLITNCQRMLDYMDFLKDAGLSTASYLDRIDGNVQRKDFEMRMSKGVPCDMHQQWRFYESISGNAPLHQILRSFPLTRSEWMPILYNLVRLKLVTIQDKPLTRLPGAFLEPAELDQGAIEKFLSAATYPADGLMSKGLFLWLLQQEFYRFERSGSRFALVLFSLATSSLLDGTLSALDAASFNEACRRILVSKRRLDLVGHFDNEYAMLLPETDSAGAAVFANRILQLWKKPPLNESLDSASISLVGSFGIASVPDDVRDLGTLVAAARIAKKKSSMMGSSVVLYTE
jgi:GGDEF domain-containing protein